jgi:putative aldouronate transport system permease protein
LIIPQVALSIPFSTLMVATAFQQVPKELVEAAVMDGADHFTYFFRCVLPLSGTIIAVLSVYYGVARWNDYFTGLVFILRLGYHRELVA